MRRADRTSIGDQTLTRENVVAAWNDISGTTPIRDVHEAFDKALTTLSNPNEDWNKRCQQLKVLRAIVLQAPEDALPHYLPMINAFTDALEKSVKDLRSQIVKEAALTISFLVNQYKMDLRPLAELCLPAAFSQIAVSTKIIASSAALMATFLVQEIHSKQMFGIIASYVTSKDKSHRKHAVTLLGIVLESWPEKAKRPMMKQLCTLLKTSINDADSDTRIAARKAFQVLDNQHPDEAEDLFRSVDASKQKLLRAPNGGSSTSSLNGDSLRSTPFRSKLSAGPKPAGFLSKRSTSAAMDKVDTSPGGSKFTRPALSMMSRTTSSLRNSSLIPGPKSSIPATRRSDNTSSMTTSRIERVKSNLGPDSFCGSLSNEQAIEFEKKMRLNGEILRQPSKNADDEFLLPVKPMPQPSNVSLSRVDSVLKAVTSTAASEKREGIQKLLSVVGDPELTAAEVQKIGDALNRLASEITSPVILDTICLLVQTHHGKLSGWLISGLRQLFAMTEVLAPAQKKQVLKAIECVLQTFEPTSLLKTQCEIVTNPIIIMKNTARTPFLNFLAEVFKKLVPTDLQKTIIHVGMENLKKTMLKVVDWVADVKSGSSVQPAVEDALRALFALNNNLFFSIFEDVDEKHRAFINSVGPSPPIRRISEDLQNLPKSRRSAPLFLSPKVDTPSPRTKLSTLGPLRPINNQDEIEQYLGKLEISSHSQEIIPEPSEDVKIANNLRMMQMPAEREKLDGLIRMQKMITDGSFTMWEAWFPRVRDELFIVMQTGSDACKRRALRFITRLCERRASDMSASTEQAIRIAIDCAVTSADTTTKLDAKECLKTLATSMTMSRVVETMLNELNGDVDDRKEVVVEMISGMCEKLDDFELKEVVEALAPRLVQIYSNGLSLKMRKGAVRGLQSMRNKMGDAALKPYIDKLPQRKLDILERGQPSEDKSEC